MQFGDGKMPVLSKVWQQFTVNDETGVCDICRKDIKLSKYKSTGHLWRHLKQDHRLEYENLRKKVKIINVNHRRVPQRNMLKQRRKLKIVRNIGRRGIGAAKKMRLIYLPDEVGVRTERHILKPNGWNTNRLMIV